MLSRHAVFCIEGADKHFDFPATFPSILSNLRN